VKLHEVRDYDWDEDLLDAVRRERKAICRIYQPPYTAVVLGRGSRLEVEVNVDEVAKDGIDLLRRRGGGCAVVLDTGNLVISVALPLPGLGGIPPAFENISDWIINALASSGVHGVRREGISDLTRDNRKIGGACIYRTRGLLYYSTTLLLNPGIELVERYLKHPPREPTYRAARSHRDFMGSLVDLATDADIDGFAKQIDRQLQSTVEALELSLTNCHDSSNSKQEVLI
jgi:lipoate-protein ligase A